MEFREMSISGAWVITPRQFRDERGLFAESFKASEFERATGHRFDLRQVNVSVSAAGVLRGIHYTLTPPGQAKYVCCVRGAFFDVVVDLRPDSPTYGRWEGVLLDDVDRRSIYLADGLGHALLSLEDGSTVHYLCSLEYSPEFDRDLDAFDPGLAIDWPTVGRDGRRLTYTRSPKDAVAPPFSRRTPPTSVEVEGVGLVGR
ncbi:dTDP-4-keto-6-deoxy-D-glucose epimerase [Nocardia panacis]|uniref:dTDP-4-keto-6-deoxy-D-glucose epimerase n=1 Tax=Nocardia panacis TaxID=2340916 RepID=A0A3A4L463_9NOCA|nr:dTDP-4-dehydrorhamnose 3,5-epimerase family protein [Nocardia panacis]RJO77113.1 dTDP-4-keto-6-deoxy-D-glucose epimerase [Nocardia panacis]